MAASIDKYKLCMEVAIANGKPDWDLLAKELGSKSANSLKTTFSNHRKAYIDEKNKFKGVFDGDDQTETTPIKAQGRKRKQGEAEQVTKVKKPRQSAVKKPASAAQMQTTEDTAVDEAGGEGEDDD